MIALIKQFNSSFFVPYKHPGLMTAVVTGCLGITFVANKTFSAYSQEKEEENALDRKMHEILQVRLEQTEAELERLRSNGTLTPPLEKKVDEILIFRQQNQPEVKRTWAQALEIKKIYQETHYVFIHAQKSDWLPTIYLIKELERVFNPEKNLRFFKFLRSSHLYASDKTEELSLLLKGDKQKFIKTDDHSLRNELLSVDAYFFNNQVLESAFFFLSFNTSIFNRQQYTAISYVNEEAIKKFLNSYDKHHQAVRLANRVNALISDKLKEAPHGNLFVICVPKENLNDSAKNLQFRSHPFGNICMCHPEKEKEILQELQDGLLTATSLCKDNSIPQYRLITSKITLENNIKVFLLTALEKEERKKIKKTIVEIAQEVKQLSEKSNFIVCI